MASSRINTKLEVAEATMKLAVLIDADNAQASVIENLFAEIAFFGEAIVKRVYGDFTSPNSATWKKTLQKFAIKPVQQFAYSTGKNATDSTLIIDAMDLLYTRKFDGFCLVTSDSDFTGLATRVREEGLSVFGFGEQKTPEAFRNACNKFIFTEVLRNEKQQTISSGTVTKSQKKHKADTASDPISGLILTALKQSGDESGWSRLGTIGSYLTKILPEFDPRNYGFKKLSELVKAKSDVIETEEREFSGDRQLYVRAKRNAHSQ